MRFSQAWMVDVSNNNQRLGKLTHCKSRLNSFAFAGVVFEQELVTSLIFERPLFLAIRWGCQQAIRKRLGTPFVLP